MPIVIDNSQRKTSIDSIFMHGEEVRIANEIGIIIDWKLNFKEKGSNVCQKEAKKIALLSKISRNITIEARNNVYKSDSTPHFDYYATITMQRLVCND